MGNEARTAWFATKGMHPIIRLLMIHLSIDKSNEKRTL
jgi:hypothetical protein